MTFFHSPLASVLAGVLFAGTGATIVAATKTRTGPGLGADPGAGEQRNAGPAPERDR